MTDTTRQADAAAGAPEMPEPMMIDFACGASGFRGKMPAYSTDVVRAYGQAMAEHARRVALEEAASMAENYDLGTWDGHDIAVAIRAAAQQKGQANA